MEKKKIWTIVGIALVIVVIGLYANMTGGMIGEEEKLKVIDGTFNTVDVNGEVYEVSADIDYDRGIVTLEVSRLGKSLGEGKAIMGQELVFTGEDNEIRVMVANIKKTWDRKAYAVLRVSEF